MVSQYSVFNDIRALNLCYTGLDLLLTSRVDEWPK